MSATPLRCSSLRLNSPLPVWILRAASALRFCAVRNSPARDHARQPKKAGIAANASRPATRRAARRIVQSLPGCSVNRRDKTGIARRKSARAAPDTRAPRPAESTAPRLLSRLRLARHQREQLRFELRELHRARRAVRMYHHVPSRDNLLAMQSQRLSDAPSDSVPRHGVAQRFLHAHPEPRFLASVGSQENYECWTRPSPPPAVDGLELRAPHQPPFVRQIAFPRRAGGVHRFAQTRVRLWRPFRRRRARTLRPPFVFILARKPCFLWRRRTCG